jgi:hypothetical protein
MSENGGKNREARIQLGSCPEEKDVRFETECRFPADQDLAAQLSQCAGLEIPSKYSAGQVRFLMVHLFFGLLFTALGLVCLFYFWPEYAGSNAAIPGATLIFLGGGLIGSIGAPIYMIYRIYDFFRGARQGSPEDVIKSFISDFDNGNYSRSWVCLTPAAQESLASEKDFIKQLEELKKKTASELNGLLGATGKVSDEAAEEFNVTVSQAYSAKDVEITSNHDEIALIDYDLVVEQSRSLSRKKDNKFFGMVKDGRVTFPQRNAAVLWGDKWYLASGALQTVAV